MTEKEKSIKFLSLVYPEIKNTDDLIHIIRYNLWHEINKNLKLTKQEQAKRWLSLIYPENNKVEINPFYLKGYTKSEILESFSHFRSYMISLFTGISEGNIDFPSELRCIFAVISAIANSGKLNGDILSVNIKALKERLRKPPKADKDAVINLLKDNGFVFKGDMFSGKEQTCLIEFPDNNLVLKGLYLFSITQDYEINQGMNSFPYYQPMHILLNPRLFEYTTERKGKFTFSKMPFIFDDLFRFFDGDEEKEAIRYFHEKMLEHGYKFNFFINIFERGKEFSDVYLRYDFKQNDDFTQGDPRAVIRVNLENRIPGIGIKIEDMRKYNDCVENCSAIFKLSLNILFDDCRTDRCSKKEHKEPCKHRLEYTLDGAQYCKCTYSSWRYKWNQTVFTANKNDIDTCLYFVLENDVKKRKVI